MLLLLLITFVLTIYFFIQHIYRFFINRGLQIGYKKYPLWEFCFSIIFRRKNGFEMSDAIYKDIKKNGGLGGSFVFLTPRLVIADKELLKIITVKQFDHFMNHALFSDETQESNLSNRNLFGIKGQLWKNLRTTVSPAFTANKLKIILPIVDKYSDETVKYLIDEYKKEMLKNNKDILKIDLKDIFTRFTNDVIASAAFGIEVDSLNNPKNKFYLMARTILNFGLLQSIKFIIFLLSSRLLNRIWPKGLLDGEALDYFRDIVQETLDKRRKEGIVRNDMINLLIEASNKSKHKKDDSNKSDLGEIIELTDEDIIGQCIQFIIGGLDTIATTISSTAYQLAEYPEIQTKIREEIRVEEEKLKENHVNYEFIRDLKYLDMVLSEALRRVPPLAILDRKCSKRFTFPATDFHSKYTIEAGEEISIPAYGFHMDPEFYPEPEKFIPERFSNDYSPKVDPNTYLAFGIGPRMCIANRYARMECKTLLYYLLKHFDIVPVEETSFPLKFTRKTFEVKPENGFIVGLRLRNQSE